MSMAPLTENPEFKKFLVRVKEHYELNPYCAMTDSEVFTPLGGKNEYWATVARNVLGVEGQPQRQYAKRVKRFEEYLNGRTKAPYNTTVLARLLGYSRRTVEDTLKRMGVEQCYDDVEPPPTADYLGFPAAWRNPLLESWPRAKGIDEYLKDRSQDLEDRLAA